MTQARHITACFSAGGSPGAVILGVERLDDGSEYAPVMLDHDEPRFRVLNSTELDLYELGGEWLDDGALEEAIQIALERNHAGPCRIRRPTVRVAGANEADPVMLELSPPRWPHFDTRCFLSALDYRVIVGIVPKHPLAPEGFACVGMAGPDGAGMRYSRLVPLPSGSFSGDGPAELHIGFIQDISAWGWREVMSDFKPIFPRLRKQVFDIDIKTGKGRFG